MFETYDFSRFGIELEKCLVEASATIKSDVYQSGTFEFLFTIGIVIWHLVLFLFFALLLLAIFSFFFDN